MHFPTTNTYTTGNAFLIQSKREITSSPNDHRDKIIPKGKSEREKWIEREGDKAFFAASLHFAQAKTHTHTLTAQTG